MENFDIELPECVVVKTSSGEYNEIFCPNLKFAEIDDILKYINLLNAIGINKSITGKK